MSTSDEPLDAYEAHFQRDPLPNAGVRVIVLANGVAARYETVAESLSRLLTARGRAVDTVVVPIESEGMGRAVERGLEGASAPLVLITSAEESWTDAHLDPLLKAIDHCDHVLGCRRISLPARLGRRLARIPWRFVFAIPVQDVHSPCRLHRLDKLATIPLQSLTSFLDVEILAKATFFGHLIDEVDVPPLATPDWPSFWHDFVEVFRHPMLLKPSSPAEDPQRDIECTDRPGSEDQQGGCDIEPPSPLKDDPS